MKKTGFRVVFCSRRNVFPSAMKTLAKWFAAYAAATIRRDHRGFVFILLLAAMSNGAVAVHLQRESDAPAPEWIETGHSELCVLYSSAATIRRIGDFVRIWELIDHKPLYQVGDGKPHYSIKRQSEYDCEQNRWRTLDLYFYSEHMATGEVVYRSATPDDWNPVPAGSVGHALKEFACKQQ